MEEEPYKQLSKFDKFQQFKETNFSRDERHHAAVYLKALWLNDTETLNEFERFGETVFEFMLNKRTYDKKRELGYDDISFDENGWIIEPKFEIDEKISFDIKKFYGTNKIEVSKTIKDKWIIGITFNTNNSGIGNGISIWGTIYDSKKEAQIDGLMKMIDFHKSSNEAVSKTIIKLATDKLNELSGHGQTNLFSE